MIHKITADNINTIKLICKPLFYSHAYNTQTESNPADLNFATRNCYKQVNYSSVRLTQSPIIN